MAKGLSPIIGLAVVMALALAAVFGSMSLAPNPAAAVGPAITGLMVTDVSESSVSLKWDFIAEHAEDGDYRATWSKPAPGGTVLFGEEVDSGTSAPFAVTPGSAATATAAMAPTTAILTPVGTSRLPFSVGDEFTVYVQSRADPADAGAYASVIATPAAVPDVPDYQDYDYDGDTDRTDSVTPTPVAQLGAIIGEPGEVTLKWAFTTSDLDPAPNVTGWEYQATRGGTAEGWMPIGTVTTAVDDTLTVYTAVLTNQKGAATYMIRPVNGQAKGGTGAVPDDISNSVTPADPPPPPKTYTTEEIAMAAEVDPGSIKPGSNTRYDISFITTKDVHTLTDAELVFKMEDYGIPSTISASTFAITVDKPAGTAVDDRDFIPEDVTVDDDEIIITIGDMLTRDDDAEDFDLPMGSLVTVVMRQSAGISNPTEYGEYGVSITLGDEAVDLDWEAEHTNDDGDDVKTYPGLSYQVPRTVSIDPEDGGLGEKVTVTGKGFKNGTTLTVFVDSPSVHVDEDNNAATPANNDDGDPDTTDPFMIPDGKLGSGEDVLCVVSAIDGSDVGKCEFEVTHPTFSGGVNYINAVDGRTGYAGLMGPNTATMVDWEMTDDGPVITHDYLAEFLLEASLKATPDTGSPGEIILLQIVDFPPGNISRIEISRQTHCSGTCGNVDTQGSGNISLTIPNDVKAGAQEVRITSGVDSDVKATATVTFVGPQISVTPGQVLANQRVSLVGTGFSPGAVIANDTDGDAKAPHSISIGGKTIYGNRINDSDPVRVDNGGNWSASVDLPLAEATTAEGERAIRVADSQGRTGVVVVSIPSREVTVTPEVGRVGTIAVVRSTGFPSKNDEGSSFNVQIVYDASNGNTTTVSALPDASGRFETQLRIPTTAAIPSSNSIKVTFRDTDGVDVVTTVAHDVPEGVITLSETSGGPGSSITVNGEGFKSFVPVALVKIGTLDVTPAPKPSTDGNGMMSFDVTIPGLDVGIQTIEVNVGRTTSSTGFTVTESGINPGDIKPVAAAIEELGDNLVSVWHFNNDTKIWSFYDPTLAEGNTLTHMITGETYLIRIKSTTEVILNNDTRSLTCVGTNCWNQQVW